MNKRIGIIFFIAALGSAIIFGACGSDEGCEAYCDKMVGCGLAADSIDACMESCEEIDPSPEYVECISDLSCDDLTQFAACDEKHGSKEMKVSKTCKTFCAGPCMAALSEDEDECRESCAFYSSSEQKCFADRASESCDIWPCLSI